MRTEEDVRTVVDQLRTDFDVRECDRMEDGCIDYIGIMAQQLTQDPTEYSLSLTGKL